MFQFTDEVTWSGLLFEVMLVHPSGLSGDEGALWLLIKFPKNNIPSINFHFDHENVPIVHGWLSVSSLLW